MLMSSFLGDFDIQPTDCAEKDSHVVVAKRQDHSVFVVSIMALYLTKRGDCNGHRGKSGD